MKTRTLFLLILLLGGAAGLSGQRNPRQATGADTIAVKKIFLSRSYFLEGKPLNLSVMEWFMKDYPRAHDEINLAMMSDQFSIVGYGAGSLFLLSGMLIYRQNRDAGFDLLQVGGVCLAGGIVFQVISGKFKRNAVRLYNDAVKSGPGNARSSTASYSIEIGDGGKVGLLVSFE
ncbi:MAG: hypothetical protein H6562_09740 [Lewinellaceae bacterium]|nr:hypothetical protein [Lewinella sp.]MCB9279185.1 hypothetical protein [Lewinellaceae bacterium]